MTDMSSPGDPVCEGTRGIGLISLVTPVYNCAEDLHRCVNSVLGQIYTNWELILVDDGSMDESAAICDDFAMTDRRITVVHRQNGGPSTARNVGIERARGRFYYFLDADDFLDADALAVLANDYGEHATDWVVTGCKWIDAQGAVLRNEPFMERSALLSRQDLLGYLESYLREPNRTPMFTCVWGKLFDGDIIRSHSLRFDSALRVFEDADFNFRYLKYVQKMSYVAGHSYNYKYMAYYVSASTRILDHPTKVLDQVKAMASLGDLFAPHRPGQRLEQIVGHATITLTIIQLVRLCGQVGVQQFRAARRIVALVTDDPMIRTCLPYYQPRSDHESRVLPVLIRFRLLSTIVAVCRYKAARRYGRP